MLKRYAASISLFLTIADFVVVGAACIATYFIRFNLGIFSTTKGIPDFRDHLILTCPIVFFFYMGCLWSGLRKKI
jgi:hypothetical protein